MKMLSLGSVVSGFLLLANATSSFAVERLAITCKDAIQRPATGTVVQIFQDNVEGTLRAELTGISINGGKAYKLNVCETIDPRATGGDATGSIICNDGKFENGYGVNITTGGFAGIGNATVYRQDQAGESSKIATLVCRYTTF